MRTLSGRHARVARLGRLSRQRRERAGENSFVLDGPTLLDEAVRAGVVVDEVFVDPGAVDRPDIVAVVERATAGGAAAWVVTGGLKGHVDPTTPNGVAAIARIPSTPARVSGAAAPLHLVLVDVSDPGNVGTLLRTAEAVGTESVVVTGVSADIWSPKVVRASAGSIMRVPVRSGAADTVLDELGAAGVRRVGSRPGGSQAPFDVDLTGPVALVVGSEAHGLPAEIDGRIDVWVSLPMQGSVDSLNVAIAGSVLAFEAARQRATTSGTDL